jgi:hypothetical protein
MGMFTSNSLTLLVQDHKANINEGADSRELLASMPIRDAKVASCVFGKTVEAFAQRLVINFHPECEKPLRRLRFRHASSYRFVFFVYLGT